MIPTCRNPPLPTACGSARGCPPPPAPTIPLLSGEDHTFLEVAGQSLGLSVPLAVLGLAAPLPPPLSCLSILGPAQPGRRLTWGPVLSSPSSSRSAVCSTPGGSASLVSGSTSMPFLRKFGKTWRKGKCHPRGLLASPALRPECSLPAWVRAGPSWGRCAALFLGSLEQPPALGEMESACSSSRAWASHGRRPVGPAPAPELLSAGRRAGAKGSQGQTSWPPRSPWGWRALCAVPTLRLIQELSPRARLLCWVLGTAALMHRPAASELSQCGGPCGVSSLSRSGSSPAPGPAPRQGTGMPLASCPHTHPGAQSCSVRLPLSTVNSSPTA